MGDLSENISSVIERHRLAVLLDEAQFDDAGNAFNERKAAATLAAESLAYVEMIAEPCATPADVQAKLDYLLNGSIGARNTLLECLGLDDYGGDGARETLLRSFMIPRI